MNKHPQHHFYINRIHDNEFVVRTDIYPKNWKHTDVFYVEVSMTYTLMINDEISFKLLFSDYPQLDIKKQIETMLPNILLDDLFVKGFNIEIKNICALKNYIENGEGITRW